jgi:hypothetical protein
MCYAELVSKEKLIMERGLLASSKNNPVRPTHSARARSLVDRALSYDRPPMEEQRQVEQQGSAVDDDTFPGMPNDENMDM